MKKLTDEEIQEIIWGGFCSIPIGESEQIKREQLILLVAEVLEYRKQNNNNNQ
jgi:hypothetical protein